MGGTARLELMLASRYLRSRKGRGRKLYFAPTALSMVSAGLEIARVIVLHKHDPWQVAGRLHWGMLCTIAGAWILFVLLHLIRRYTIFSSISTYGLFLGSSALVVVLSIMS